MSHIDALMVIMSLLYVVQEFSRMLLSYRNALVLVQAAGISRVV